MTLEQWVHNNRGIGAGGRNLRRPLLEQLYDNILRDEIKIEQREFIHAAKSEGWLLKRGGKVKTWKRRCASFDTV